jgi:tRNA pseudouridine55 synthase
MHGLLNIDKPAGISSRAVVNRIERVLEPLAVGHAGTLDPLATGVLVLCVGRATKLIDYLHRFSKTYVATFLLGRSSDTEDVTGAVSEVENAPQPTREEFERAVPQFLGEIQQQPPAYSALKVDGKRAYKLARRGREVQLQPRPIVVQRFVLQRYEYPELQAEIECGTGTYVRSLGRDLARAVGTEAVMSALQRTRIGPFAIEQSVAPDDVHGDNVSVLLQPSLLAIGDMPRVTLRADQAAELQRSGVLFDLPPPVRADQELAALAQDGRLFSILTPSKGDRWKVRILLG